MTLEASANLIRSLGDELGIEGLELDEYGYCCLEFPDQTINIEADDAGLIFLYSHLGNLPAENQTEFYAQLLEANYFWQQTGGACIGIDRAANVVLLAAQAHVSSLYITDLKNMLENFLNIAVTWTRRIQAFDGSPASTDQEKDLSFHNMIRV